jgi:hypothetical protein
MHYTVEEAGMLILQPLDKLDVIVKKWASRNRDDKDDRFEDLPEPRSVGALGASPSTITTASLDNNSMHNVDNSAGLTWHSDIKMDGQTSAAILSYCNLYAATRSQTVLQRTGLVTKHDVAASNTSYTNTRNGVPLMEAPLDIRWETLPLPGVAPGSYSVFPTNDTTLAADASYSTVSSGMCVGFSPSGHTQIYYTNPRNAPSSASHLDFGLPRWSDGRLASENSIDRYTDGIFDSTSSNNASDVELGNEPTFSFDEDGSFAQLPTTPMKRSKSAPTMSSPYTLDSPHNPLSPMASLDTSLGSDHLGAFDTEYESAYRLPSTNTLGLVFDTTGFDLVEMPKTPLKGNSGTFDYGMWTEPHSSNNSRVSVQLESLDNLTTAIAICGSERLGIEARATSFAPVSSLRVVKRKPGVPNLRAAAAVHSAMESENCMVPPTTSVLRNVLMEQRGLGISYVRSTVCCSCAHPSLIATTRAI